MLEWIFGQNKKKSTAFPTKKGINAVSCVSLLDLHGSLFCLDNQHILFYENGVAKVLAPITIKPMEDDSFSDYDAFDIDDKSFAIRYKRKDYIYRAHFEVTKLRDNIYIKITDIDQEVYDTKIKDGCIVTVTGETPV